jgi:transposase
MDVHAETITAAIADGRWRIRNLGKFPDRPEAVRKLIEKLGGGKSLKVRYEAVPTGYALCWQLTKLGVDCEVVAPSLIPRKPGHRVKTDRRDAEKLARCYQNGYTGIVSLEQPLRSCRPQVRFSRVENESAYTCVLTEDHRYVENLSYDDVFAGGTGTVRLLGRRRRRWWYWRKQGARRDVHWW